MINVACPCLQTAQLHPAPPHTGQNWVSPEHAGALVPSEHRPQVPFAVDQHPVGALGPCGAHPTLGITVGPRRPRRNLDHCGNRQHAVEQALPVDTHIPAGRFLAGVAEHGRDRRQRDRRGAAAWTRRCGEGTGSRHSHRSLRPCGTSRYHPVHGGVIGQPHVRRHRAQEHVVIGRAGPLVQHVVGEPAHHQRRQRQASAGCPSSAARSRSSGRASRHLPGAAPTMSQARSPVVSASRVIAASRALTAPDAHAATTRSSSLVAEHGDDHVGTPDAGQVHRGDQVGTAGELQERAEVRHHPEQRRALPTCPAGTPGTPARWRRQPRPGQ